MHEHLVGSRTLMLAALSLTLPACGGPDERPAEEQIGQHSSNVVLGDCYHGMSTSLKEVNVKAPRCNVEQLPELLNYVCNGSQPEVCTFLTDVLDGHGSIQCQQDAQTQEWCVDIVNRYDATRDMNGRPPDISSKNYFLAYVDDHRIPIVSEQVKYWDDALLEPANTSPPVELSFAGLYTPNTVGDPEFVYPGDPDPDDDFRVDRLLKFDPKGCSACGNYEGPNLDWLTDFGLMELEHGWWPYFEGPPVCMFSQQLFDYDENGGQQEENYQAYLIELPEEECLNEAMYRETWTWLP